MYEGHMGKANGGTFESGWWEWVGQEGVVGGKWRELYLNSKKYKIKKIKKQN